MRLIDADALHKSFEEVYNHPDSMFRDSAWWFFGKLEEAPTITLTSNAPLTLDELREMDGKPVWNDTIEKYALVDAGWDNGFGRTVDARGKWRPLDDIYYRRRPEEGTK